MNADDKREALAAAIGADVDEWVIDAIQDNRDAVLRALGLREERREVRTASQAVVGYPPVTFPRTYQHRFVTDWEDVTDE